MNPAILLSVFDTVYISAAVYGVTAALALLSTVVVGREGSSMHSVSPLWLVVPTLVAAAFLASGRAGILAVSLQGVTLPVALLIQLGVAAWVLWHHGRFPWFVFPLAVATCWIQWSFFQVVAARG